MNAVTKALLGLFVASALSTAAFVWFTQAVRVGKIGPALVFAVSFLLMLWGVWRFAQDWRRARGWRSGRNRRTKGGPE